MRVLFLSPDTHVYNHHFVEGLKSIGASVHAIGPGAKPSPRLARLLDGYAPCRRLLDPEPMLDAARRLGGSFDRIETIDEPLVEMAATLRERLDAPGLSVEAARLCRDKVAMKDFLREHEVPCAQSTKATAPHDVHAFAEQFGFPLIVKPVAGFGSLQTWRLTSAAEIDDLLATTTVSSENPAAIEEYVEGHEGFYDTITDESGVRFDFAAHYYPGCLEATHDRSIAPQIAVTNRIDTDTGGGYDELRTMGARVVDALGLHGTATHMEWFFGPKGLKFSEIGARPAGEKIWDMYKFANEFDVYREWALATAGRPAQGAPTRRYAAGSIQIRPDRDGTFVGHDGLEAVWKRCGDAIYEYEVPKAGEQTKGLDKGWLVNTWFRLRHEDYDTVRELMTFIGNTVASRAK